MTVDRKHRLVAVEEHFGTPSLLAALGENMRDDYPIMRWPPPLTERMMDVGEARIADMDAGGVDVQVLSLTQPALEVIPAESAVPLARELNDFLAERIAAHPTRFAGLAAVPAVAP